MLVPVFLGFGVAQLVSLVDRSLVVIDVTGQALDVRVDVFTSLGWRRSIFLAAAPFLVCSFVVGVVAAILVVRFLFEATAFIFVTHSLLNTLPQPCLWVEASFPPLGRGGSYRGDVFVLAPAVFPLIPRLFTLSSCQIFRQLLSGYSVDWP